MKVSGFPSSFLRNYAETGRRQNHQCMLTVDGEAGDTLLRIFSLNTLPLYRSGLFSLNLWHVRVTEKTAFHTKCLTPRGLAGILTPAAGSTPGGIAGKPRQDREVATVFRLCLSGCCSRWFFVLFRRNPAQEEMFHSRTGMK